MCSVHVISAVWKFTRTLIHFSKNDYLYTREIGKKTELCEGVFDLTAYPIENPEWKGVFVRDSEIYCENGMKTDRWMSIHGRYTCMCNIWRNIFFCEIDTNNKSPSSISDVLIQGFSGSTCTLCHSATDRYGI